MQNSSDIVLVTGTLYKKTDTVRISLATSMLEKARELHLPVIIVDSGSSGEITARFSQLGAKVVDYDAKTMAGSRKEAISQGYENGAKYIVWLEPEKVNLISHLDRCIEFLEKENGDIVIPKRRSLASLPMTQQLSERLGNTYVQELTGLDLDLFFGPRIFKRDVASYFLDYDEAKGTLWEILFAPVFQMLVDKKNVLSVPIDYEHPQSQTSEEEDNVQFTEKRIDQLTRITKLATEYFKV